ncbi:MAG: 16S rRNA processing protein RimM [Deltaproteobacteria bacterium]|nr:16S rRNA processing protein RimM [Deltaproteobacteria bacterium]
MDHHSLPAENEFVALGKFGSAWGIKGELKLHLYNFRSENIKKARQLYYSPAGFSFEPLQLLSLKQLPKMWVAKFEQFHSPESVSALKGREFFLLKKDLELSKNLEEFYAFELKDFVVMNEESQRLGKVRNLLYYGASELLEVFNEATNKEELIPFVKDFVLKLDRDLKVITVRWSNLD